MIFFISNLQGLPLSGLDDHQDDLSEEIEYQYDFDGFNFITHEDTENFDFISDEVNPLKLRSEYSDLSDDTNKNLTPKKSSQKPSKVIILVPIPNDKKIIKTTTTTTTITSKKNLSSIKPTTSRKASSTPNKSSPKPTKPFNSIPVSDNMKTIQITSKLI